MRNFAAFLIAGALLFAQGDRGTITGIVTDPTGQIVPGVQVAITNEATGIKSATVSSDSGSYTLPLLMVGTYRVDARAAGFKTSEHPAVPVQVGQVTRIDIQLEVGQVQEQVTVAAAAPLLNTDASDVGIVMNENAFLNLPLTLGGDFRHASSFIFLSLASSLSIPRGTFSTTWPARA